MIVAVEGLDGAGKHTQAELLIGRATGAGLRAQVLSFPRYSETFFSTVIEKYLSGIYSDGCKMSPYVSALLFAGDRLESRDYLLAQVDLNDLVILDRYVASNVAYQCARLFSKQERQRLTKWIAQLEYGFFGLPRPDLTVYLDITIDAARESISQRKPKIPAVDASGDIYEQDTEYLKRCNQVYRTLAKESFSSPWLIVPGVSSEGTRKDPSELCDIIWSAIEVA